MQNACIALAAILLLSACDEKEMCFPQKPAQTAASIRPTNNRPRPLPPRNVTIVFDRSWGMAGFIRRRTDGPMQPPVGEFHSVVSALPAQFTSLYAVQLPDETNPTAEARHVSIQDMADERSFTCDHRGCAGFSANAFLYRFLARARGQGPSVGDSLKLSEEMDTVVVLLTDLQPDVEPGNKQGSRMGYIQKELKTVVGSLGLTVGIVPVPARFYGTVWDTEAASDPVLLAGNQRQPFFFVPIGREDQVRWTLERLKLAIKDGTGQPALKDYLFRRTPEQPTSVGFELTLPKTEKLETPSVEFAAPPPSQDDFSKTLNGSYLVVNRSSALQHPTQLTASSTVPGFEVQVSQTSNPKIWQYIGGSYTAADCGKRWHDVSDTATALAVAPANDTNGNLNAALGQATIQDLNVGAIYYVEEAIEYQFSPKAESPPDWVQKWNAEPRQAFPDKPKDGNIAFGVNSLKRLFDETRAAEASQPRQATLRYAIEIRK